MRVYQFTEQPYPDAWKDHGGSLRVNLPNRKCDPTIAADLFHRYYDEWLLADELGFDIMLNEHHQTATCMSSTVIVGLSILARQTKRARVVAGTQSRNHVSTLAEDARIALAAGGAPDRRVRLLPGARPDVHMAIVEVFTLPVERLVMTRHRLHNKVVGFPKAVHYADRTLVRARKFVRHALDETHVEPAARYNVNGRKLLGNTQWILPVTDRVPEHEETRALGLACQY